MAPGIGAASGAAERMAEEARGSVVEVTTGRRGAGAGMIWPGGALVLTNDHVVSAGRPGRGWRRGRSPILQVSPRDGRTFDAEVAKRSGRLDPALLRLKDGPASSSGLVVGDVLLGTENGPVSFAGATDLSDVLVRAGETVRLRIKRGGEAFAVSVDLGAPGRAA